MSDVNVIFAVNQVTWDALKKNFQYNEDGTRVREDLTVTQANKLRTNISGHWATPDIGGTLYNVVSWYVPNIPTTSDENDLKWVEFLLTEFPSKFHIIGAWNKDGSQFGTTLVHTKNGVDLVDEYVRVPVYTDVEVVDVEATIANQTVTMKTVTETSYETQPTGQQVEVPHIDTTVEGTPVYPIHAQYLKVFPTGVPEEVNNILGWKDRRWS